MRKLLLLILLFTTVFAFGQNTESRVVEFSCEQIKSANDILNALDAGNAGKIIIKCSPTGSGEKVEVASGRKKDKYFFEKENNVVWIKFKMNFNTNLVFDIIPRSKNDDYDFLLFKTESRKSIELISNSKAKPVRSNMSRNKVELKGVTGLSYNGTSAHVVSGVQNEYSKPLEVKQGDIYYLALNNVYNNGQGAIIKFKYQQYTTINGVVKSSIDDKTLANTEVVWEDLQSGEELAKTTTDENGNFKIKVPFDSSQPSKKYVLSAYTEKHFFKERTYSSKELSTKNTKPLNMVLTELKKGKKNKIHNINFYGDVAQFLPGAYPSLKRLLKLMKKNKTLKIKIEGHTNTCTGGFEFTQRLSKDRADAVKTYLTENKINIERMETVGYNCKYMLYPNPANEKQASLNRRVEILVTDY